MNYENCLDEILRAKGLSWQDLPSNLSLTKLHEWNPGEVFESPLEAVYQLCISDPPKRVRLSGDEHVNAAIWVKLGHRSEELCNFQRAADYYFLALQSRASGKCLENLGNIRKRQGRLTESSCLYEESLKYTDHSHWVYINLSQCYDGLHQHAKAITLILSGLENGEDRPTLLAEFDRLLASQWETIEQRIWFLATVQDRTSLILDYETLAQSFSQSYSLSLIFREIPLEECSPRAVLIIGTPEEYAPQCYRYRVAQKIEQLACAGYDASFIPWTKCSQTVHGWHHAATVIFYRVPAIPEVLGTIARAKRAGKITIFETDDLLFEEYSVPPFETYGGSISTDVYRSITRDIGSHRAAAKLCDYGLASTQQLCDKLKSLVTTGVCYLHRNGLDKWSNEAHLSIPPQHGHVTIFYGSGTLAHNSDFLIEALPAIELILRRHPQSLLVIAGYLSLPKPFVKEFSERLTFFPFTDLDTYLARLSSADINIAVLSDDIVAGSKSEVKWIEAAVYGIPSVVSRTANYVDVVRHGIDGFVVSNTVEWVAALEILIASKEARTRVGRAAKHRVLADYSVEALSGNIAEIIRKVGRSTERTSV